MDLGLKGKTALVTAASAGLGYATAAALSAEGARVAICSRDLGRAQASAERIQAETGNEVLAFEADVANATDLTRLFGEVQTAFGSLDILVCNAGGPPPGNFSALSEEQWATGVQLTLMSVVRSVRLALPLMRQAGGGRILTLLSSSVKKPIDNLTLSNTFRPAVYGLCKSLSLELAVDNIQVNGLAPGRIETERINQLDDAQAQKRGISRAEIRTASEAQIPMGRLGQPQEFGRVAAFLCSPAAIYVNGSVLLVDGGAVTSL
ncbi:SDR family oxidoreductase [Deinococcus marmoris]|uniref:3-oxoacyl-[acyl-carrier protein] reductase n=1 Tax=Deinococcus marmoris TaxID=249408 RepID=A0A1U7NXC1_9DEIO|nr:SDR family oxidoreductase [Deinococcus marmoris]OLV17573.1 3-oxoacyl-[acyl-carrier protein] reductase [Deinococcus marmoris]